MPAKQTSGSHWGLFHPEVANNRVVGVTPFDHDPDPSPILKSIPAMADHPARILRPAVREGYLNRGRNDFTRKRGGEAFVEVSWERALELAAEALEQTRSEAGNQAIYAGSYGWGSAGRLHSGSALLHRFMNCIGGFTASSGTYSLAAGEVILPRILGSRGQTTAWETLVGTTQLHVSFGGVPLKNAQITHGGMGRHSTRDWLLKMHQSGTRFINISPIRDDLMAQLGAQWIPIRPNTDTALMLGIAHTLCSEKLHAAEFLLRYCEGSEHFLAYLNGAQDQQPKSAQWAAAITDVPAAVIRQLARDLASQRSFLNASWSIQRGDHGEQPYWMLMTLACLLGQIGRPGGGFGYGYGAMGGIGEMGATIQWPSLPTPGNPVGDAIPVARIADMLLNPGGNYDFNGERDQYPHIDLIYWAGGNPFHHHQDINRLIQAWNKPGTVIVNDSFWTATARHADIVLPVATTLERDDVGWGPMDQICYTMPKLQPMPGDVKLEWDLFADLAANMGVKQEFTGGLTPQQWLEKLYEQARQHAAQQEFDMPAFENFWQRGHTDLPPADQPTPGYSDFIDDPQGQPLKTPSGKFEIYSQIIASFNYADCPGHPTWLEPAEWLGNIGQYPLHLLSNQPATRLHSQLDFGACSVDSKINDREPMRMNPDDAQQRGLANGDVVRLYNDRGACLSGVTISDAVRPGVVELATGAWYDPLQPGETGSLDVHGNPNMLTLDKGTSSLAQGPIAQTTLIEVEKWTGEVPPITVFTPPSMVKPSK